MLEIPLALLEANRTGLLQARSVEHCLRCRCAVGNHLAVLPGDITADKLIDRTGWVEWPACDTSCGTLAVAVPSW